MFFYSSSTYLRASHQSLRSIPRSQSSLSTLYTLVLFSYLLQPLSFFSNSLALNTPLSLSHTLAIPLSFHLLTPHRFPLHSLQITKITITTLFYSPRVTLIRIESESLNNLIIIRFVRKCGGRRFKKERMIFIKTNDLILEIVRYNYWFNPVILNLFNIIFIQFPLLNKQQTFFYQFYVF